MKKIRSHWSPLKDARESIHFSEKGALPLSWLSRTDWNSRCHRVDGPKSFFRDRFQLGEKGPTDLNYHHFETLNFRNTWSKQQLMTDQTIRWKAERPGGSLYWIIGLTARESTEESKRQRQLDIRWHLRSRNRKRAICYPASLPKYPAESN